MPCIEVSRAGCAAPAPRPRPGRWQRVIGLCGVLALAGCSNRPAPAAAPVPSTAAPTPAQAPAQVGVAGGRPVLPTPAGSRDWASFKRLAAQRMVAASPTTSYLTPAPEPLLAIPVLEVELNGDGSVRRIQVLRRPSQAQDTVQLAIDAVHRAAPYGDVSRLPRPWRFTESFLFDDARRFKPRSLDD
ncbi:MAG: hypothetical protein ACKVQR_05005 [Aquabacterium sp.]